MSVFLATCDSKDFDRTVQSPIEIGKYDHPPETVSDAESVRLWGVPESSSNETNFAKLQSGDLVLFLQDGTYVGAGTVQTTFEDEWASTAVWTETSATLLYTIEDFTSVTVPKAAVNRIFGYSDSYTPPNLIRVAEERVTNSPEAIVRALEKYTEKHAGDSN